MENWYSYVCEDCDAIFEVVGILRLSEGFYRCPDCLGWSTMPDELFMETQRQTRECELT